MKFVARILLAATMAAACAPLLAQEVNLRFSADSPPSNVKVQAYQKWADLAKQKSNGRINIRIFPSAQLYNDVNAIPAVSAGTVDLAAPPSSLLTSVVPASAVFELPSLWGISYEQYRKLVEGPFGAQLEKEYESKLGVKVIGHYNIGSWIWATSAKAKPVTKPVDFQNMKIRVVGNPLVERTFKAFGAQPTQLAWPEVPTALLQGVIDGLETTLSGFDSVKGWELAKNLTFSNHKYLPFVVIMNKRAWDKIPSDMQKVLLETMDESRRWHDGEIDRMNNAALDRFKSNGATVNVLAAKDVKTFADAAMPAEKAFLESTGLGAAAATAQKSIGRD